MNHPVTANDIYMSVSSAEHMVGNDTAQRHRQIKIYVVINGKVPAVKFEGDVSTQFLWRFSIAASWSYSI